MTMASPALEAWINESIRVTNAHGYAPGDFIRVRQEKGTLTAMKQLVVSSELQSGFARMKELGIVEWSLEQGVINFPAEFTKAERQCARWRIEHRLEHAPKIKPTLEQPP